MSAQNRPQQFETRHDMLSLLSPQSVIAEIGVFEGQFSLDIYETCAPRELVLIDIWAPGLMNSGDVDGNNVREYVGEQLEQATRERMGHLPGVKIVKSPSSVLGSFPADHFDAVYIDGDHSYEGVMLDLVSAAHVVKDGGWIMGHDYDHNPARSSNRYDFGVKRAVDEFCDVYGQRIAAVGMDGCVSFAIRYRKGGALRSLRVGIFSRYVKLRSRCQRVLARCTLQGLVRRCRRLVGMKPA